MHIWKKTYSALNKKANNGVTTVSVSGKERRLPPLFFLVIQKGSCDNVTLRR